MHKYLVLLDNSRIPIDDVSDQSNAVCYPESMAQVDEWWSKLTPDTNNHQIYDDGETQFDIFNSDSLCFNKIELEHCSTGLLMRIVFASSVEKELQRLLVEKNELEEAYNVLVNGQEVPVNE